MADLIRLKSSLWILNFKHPEVEVLSVELLKAGHINLILQLSDAKILNLDRVCDSPFKADWHRR